MPRMLSFNAVQRQTATSRSTRPKIIEQQGLISGAPRFRLIRLRTFAHVESLRASLGQVIPSTKTGVMRLRKRRLMTRNRASVLELFVAIVDQWSRSCVSDLPLSYMCMFVNCSYGGYIDFEGRLIMVFILFEICSVVWLANLVSN